MGPQSDGIEQVRAGRTSGKASISRARGGNKRIEKEANLDSLEEIERLREYRTRGDSQGGLTGLGIRVLKKPPTNQRSKSFLSLGEDDDDEDDEQQQRSTKEELDDYSFRRQPRVIVNDNSDAVSITSTCADLDLTPLVNAFPCPPPSPNSLATPDESNSSLLDHRVPQLHHQPSISTISSSNTFASTSTTSSSSNSSLETPSPQTPTTSEMTPLSVAIPRPNAAALRRVRSFAKPVSVYFSPDRPPALPLPSLPLLETTTSPPLTPSLVVPSPSPLSSPSTYSPNPSTNRPQTAPTLQTPYGFYAPSYGRFITREPPKAPPPDRPLPSIPTKTIEDQDPTTTRDERLVVGSPTTSLTNSMPFPTPLKIPSNFDSNSEIRQYSSDNIVEHARSRSNESDSSTPTIKSPIENNHDDESSLTFQSRSIRTRVVSTSSIASLDISQIAHSLSELASGKTPTPAETNEAQIVVPEEEEEEEKTEKEVDRERVRRLISRVSSVIEMRKLSMASTVGSSERSSGMTDSMISINPASATRNGERNGYKAYKLARKPSLSPSNSFASFSRNSNYGGTTTTMTTVSGNRSRTSSYDDDDVDSDSESSGSEEMFDLSFDSSASSADAGLLSPSSILTSPPSFGGRNSYVRRSQIPPRWAGRRRSSATTIEEEENGGDDRLKRSATKRADEMFSRDLDVSEELEENKEEEEELLSRGTEDSQPRQTLRSVTSTDSFRSRFQSTQMNTTSTRKTLRTVSSVPILRASSSPGSTFAYTSSPLGSGSRSPQPSSTATSTPTRLKPLITSSPPQTRKSFIAPPSSCNSRIPLSGLSRNSLSPQFSDPFSSTTTSALSYRSSISNFRKSSLPVPSPVNSPPSTSTTAMSRRPSAPSSYTVVEPHRRKSSLAALSYHHSPSATPATSENSRALSPTTTTLNKMAKPISPSRIAQPSFARR
ncbi:uncharacterized protein JCM6883_005737 [Sporobolomyces salmoneus]|uniref:uncharacterized protein n=1 Tax=Sporobolomyces salmoneus TaxID=183962 RepID=UPI0031726594